MSLTEMVTFPKSLHLMVERDPIVVTIFHVFYCL